jgi:hypothetical protein
MSLGNFSDALHRLDISKMSIGFLEEINPLSRKILIKHLLHRGNNFGKTSANDAIKEFSRLLEREYWDMCFEPIRKYETSGVPMYILGRGVCNIFPRLAYCVGDDPALHRYCGIYEGNALSSCIYCNYSARNNNIFGIRQALKSVVTWQRLE